MFSKNNFSESRELFRNSLLNQREEMASSLWTHSKVPVIISSVTFQFLIQRYKSFIIVFPKKYHEPKLFNIFYVFPFQFFVVSFLESNILIFFPLFTVTYNFFKKINMESKLHSDENDATRPKFPVRTYLYLFAFHAL